MILALVVICLKHMQITKGFAFKLPVEQHLFTFPRTLIFDYKSSLSRREKYGILNKSYKCFILLAKLWTFNFSNRRYMFNGLFGFLISFDLQVFRVFPQHPVWVYCAGIVWSIA